MLSKFGVKDKSIEMKVEIIQSITKIIISGGFFPLCFQI